MTHGAMIFVSISRTIHGDLSVVTIAGFYETGGFNTVINIFNKRKIKDKFVKTLSFYVNFLFLSTKKIRSRIPPGIFVMD